MCNLAVGITCSVLGVILVAVSCIVSFGLVPGIIESMVIDQTVLIEGTEQFERFEEVPFPLSFRVFVFNITNVDEMLAGGIPMVEEIGPYVYKLKNSRLIEDIAEDLITYRRLENFEFDAVASYPYTEDDEITVINVAYHCILQAAEALLPNLIFAINTAMGNIFGEHNSPIMQVRVANFLLEGVKLCEDRSGLFGSIACDAIKLIGADVQNLKELEDGSLEFSILGYKDDFPSAEFVVKRGLDDSADLGRLVSYNGSPVFSYWVNDLDEDGEEVTSVCNMVNGTDSGIFQPFLNRDEHLFAINTDICRSLELRYQYDTDYEGIPVVRYSALEWFLDNDDGCFCLNMTQGITRENGCLLKGAMELYSCTGAFMVLSYPHFLYADPTYINGVIGMNPSEENHHIYMDLDQLTGTVIRGFKKAQFNVFSKPVTSIQATQNLRTTLMPILWIEEGIMLGEEYVDMLKTRMLRPLRLVDIFVPILIALCCLLAVLGFIIIIIRVRARNKNTFPPSISQTEVMPEVNK